jgi:DNA (cytosine-5)-methyltransferase 1
VDLTEAVRLLPTPAASNPNDGESLESWEARRQRNKAKGINGNGQGTPLAIAVKLLPTPMAGDAKGTRNATAGRKTDNPNVNPGWTLSDVVYDGQLSNPSAPPADAKSPSMTPGGSVPDATGAPTPNSDGPTKLLPTPRASDTGTPGRRASEGFRPPLSQVLLPLAEGQLLPTPTTADGERTSSTYGRGNPTLTGAITDPPSAGGKPSSDAPRPGQPTLWDD